MGYPTFATTDGFSDIVLEQGITVPYENAIMNLNQERVITRGGGAYVTQFGEPNRIIKVNIEDISSSHRESLYNFFQEIDYSSNKFIFYPEGKKRKETSVFDTTSGGIFSDFFLDRYTDKKYRVTLWQDEFNIPITRGIIRGNLDELTLLVDRTYND